MNLIFDWMSPYLIYMPWQYFSCHGKQVAFQGAPCQAVLMNKENQPPRVERQALGLEDLLNYRVQRLASQMSLKTAREVLQGSGIHIAEWRVICTLTQNGPSNVTQISRQLVLDPGRTSRLLKASETKGLVKRKPDPKDGRASIFSLTPESRELFETAWPKARAVASEFDRLFTDEERTLFVQFLDRSIGLAGKTPGDDT